jgi:dephospho-CoA kinase
MLKVGITGGIGSGKTTVCQLFEILGIPVFYADEAARALMEEDPSLVASISALFGESIYQHGKLDRAAVSAAVFGRPEKLAALNALVHPAALAAARQWLERQETPYSIKEAAIFFEAGTDVDIDIMIGVSAPVEVRIARAMSRSGMTREEVLGRMARQMDEDEKMSRCDYVIINDGNTALIPQVLRLHEELLSKASK